MHINAAKELTLLICSPLSQGTSTYTPSCIIHQENWNNLPVVKQLGSKCKSRESSWERGSFTTPDTPPQDWSLPWEQPNHYNPNPHVCAWELSRWHKHWPVATLGKGTCSVFIPGDSHSLSLGTHLRKSVLLLLLCDNPSTGYNRLHSISDLWNFGHAI